MSENDGNCKSCRETLNFSAIIFGNECPKCHQTVCDKCLNYQKHPHPYIGKGTHPSYRGKRICVKCEKSLQPLISEIIVVVSGHIGGHTITKEFGLLISPEGFNTKNEAVDWLKFSSVNLGGNAIIDLNVERSRVEGVFSYKATGKAVIIKKNERASNKKADFVSKKEPSIVEEIGQLGQLWKDGILTDEEFQMAKNKILKK